MKKIIMSGALISMAMMGCTNDSLMKDDGSQLFTLEVGKRIESRTHLDGDQLVWSEGDEIYVTSADGNVNGVLRLVAGANTPTGKFQGTVNGNTTKLKNIVYPAQVNGMSMASVEVNKLIAPMTGTIGGQQGNTLEFNCGFVKLNVLGLEDENNVGISGGNIGATLRYDVASNSWVPSENGADIVVEGAGDAEDFIVPVYVDKEEVGETTLKVMIGENNHANVTVDIGQGGVEDTKNLYIIGDELVNPSDKKTELPEGAMTVANTNELMVAYNENDVRTIVLVGGDFVLTGNLGGKTTRGELTIMGSKASKLTMNHLQDDYVGCSHLTIKGCTILRRSGHWWGFLNLGGKGKNYTISNCYFTGYDQWDDRWEDGEPNPTDIDPSREGYCQGIYINTQEGCVYNIEYCTFDGNFGGEGAITIQNNEVKCGVNIRGCEFINRGDQTARNIYVHYNKPGMELTYDIDEAQVTWAQGKPGVEK